MLAGPLALRGEVLVADALLFVTSTLWLRESPGRTVLAVGFEMAPAPTAVPEPVAIVLALVANG